MHKSLSVLPVSQRRRLLSEFCRRKVAKARDDQKPRVPTISWTDVVAHGFLGDDDIVLVDVRTEEEQAVSMIQGAIRASEFSALYLDQPVQDASERSKLLVVPYCADGHRSYLFLKKIMEFGFHSAKNSEGIVWWTHEVGSMSEDTLSLSLSGSGSTGGMASCLLGASGVRTNHVHVYSEDLSLADPSYVCEWFGPAKVLRLDAQRMLTGGGLRSKQRVHSEDLRGRSLLQSTDSTSSAGSSTRRRTSIFGALFSRGGGKESGTSSAPNLAPIPTSPASVSSPTSVGQGGASPPRSATRSRRRSSL
jgi:rhodanese-related sulfurtransferase